jgi:1-hydroxy-2-isopentenylcarotenoid 3,4-desaturase
MSNHVIIIGAGIGGLAAANLLQKAGFSVHVYEKNDQLGGRAGQKKVNGFTFDTGPSWYLMPKVFEQYLSLFGLSAQELLNLKRLTPAYKVFYESRAPLTITGELARDSATFEAVEPGAGEALQRYVSEGDEIYQLALRHFLYTNYDGLGGLMNRDILRGAPRLLRLLTQPIHQRVAQFVGTKALQQILEYPMVFLGSSPFQAPAMYSLMSALDFNEGVFYPERGIYDIITQLRHIGDELGVTYHLNSEVSAITHEGQRATGIMLKDGSTIAADSVISNADLHFTETSLVDPTVQTYPERYWQKKQSGISALLLYVGVKGELPALEHHNLFFVDDWQDNFAAIYDRREVPEHASLYVCKPTASDPSLAPAGHENIFMLLPLPTDVALTTDEREALADRCLAQLGVMAGEDVSERIVYKESFGPADFEQQFHAWEGTALGASHTLKQSALWRTPNKSGKLANLFYVGGNTLPGIGLPMCLISAELVYKRVMGDTTNGPLTAIQNRGDA